MKTIEDLTKELTIIIGLINKQTNGFALHSFKNEHEIQVTDVLDLKNIKGKVSIRKRKGDSEFPYELSKTINDVKFFVLSEADEL